MMNGMITRACGISILLSVLGGCAGGGAFDRVRAAAGDGPASARVQLREAAIMRYEPTSLLAAAHNTAQAKLPENQRHEVQSWWLDENDGVSIKAIGGTSVSSVVSKYHSLAQNRPAAGTDDETLWLDTMASYVATFRSQATILDEIADHYEQNGTSAAMSPEQLATAIAQLRERANTIRSFPVNYESGPVTAALEPGNAATVVAARPSNSNAPAVTQRAVRNTSRAVDQYQRGNLAQAGTTVGNVVFPK